MHIHTQVHASCVSIDGKGVLLLGPSGSGKSDVALRLIDGGAALVADDRVDIQYFSSPYRGEAGRGAQPGRLSQECPPPQPSPLQGEGVLVATAPENLRGMLELPGIGIMTLPYQPEIPLALAINLVPRSDIERLPEPQFWSCLGQQLPLLSLHAFDLSVCAKIRMHVRHNV